jgi:hypothetical protein
VITWFLLQAHRRRLRAIVTHEWDDAAGEMLGEIVREEARTALERAERK